MHKSEQNSRTSDASSRDEAYIYRPEIVVWNQKETQGIAMPFYALNLPDESLEVLVSKCCVLGASGNNTKTNTTTVLHQPTCHILCTSKRLRAFGNIEAIRAEIFERLFWARVQFFSRVSHSINRAIASGLPADGTQMHVLQKGNMTMEVEVNPKIYINKSGRVRACMFNLTLSMRAKVSDGLTSVGTLKSIELPTAYATKPDRRTHRQKEQIGKRMLDRSADFSNDFETLTKDFHYVGRKMFPDM